MWKSTDELLSDIHDTLVNLRASGDIETSHAECRLYNAAAKVIAISCEHAKLTGRLEGDLIPSATFGAGRQPKALPVGKKGGTKAA